MMLALTAGLLALLVAAALFAALPRTRGGFALALLVPLLAAGAYALQGSWRTQQQVQQAADDPQAAQAAMIEGMVARLAARLQQTPDDRDGWARLGRSYLVLQRHEESLRAYRRAEALGADDPEFLWFAGRAAAEAGEGAQARRYWQRLSRRKDLPAEVRATLEEKIKQLPLH